MLNNRAYYKQTEQTLINFKLLFFQPVFQLAHSVLDALKSTQRKWLVELLFSFNSGNIAAFEELRPQWQTQVFDIIRLFLPLYC